LGLVEYIRRNEEIRLRIKKEEEECLNTKKNTVAVVLKDS
jgi:DNA-directed RNA polymerase subunit E'/Rpb7